MPKILVAGGCGYIGSHTIVDLLDNGFEVISIDNFSRSTDLSLKLIKSITGKEITNYEIDLKDKEKVLSVFEKEKDIKGVIHFAAYKSVPESMMQPLMYLENNVLSLLNLLEASKVNNIENFIFSSSCSVYGNTKKLPVDEESETQNAESPYAYTKQVGERILKDYLKANPNKKGIVLRYFNPAGAHESGKLGEVLHDRASNLVPIILQVANGTREELIVHGNDYDTRDGSCIRDYIHIMDLASAHTHCLKFLLSGKTQQFDVFNFGIGQGITVLEAIKSFEKVNGKKINYKIGPRREGDVGAIYTDFSKATRKLGWTPLRDIDDIMQSVWKWENFYSTLK